MRKLIAAAFAALLVLGFAGLATAEPGPNGNNDHGLCTAYFNGQKNGHGKDGREQPGPFAALIEAGEAYTDSDGVDNDGDGEVDEEGESADLSDAENVYNFCSNTTEIGGNPIHGRYTCVDDANPDEEGEQTECTDNEGPGKS
ncbi:MAG TPA: hypothetical protein VF230_16695 [Acidimicrobiales bacterium]